MAEIKTPHLDFDNNELLPTDETHFQLSNGKLLKIFHNIPNEINAALDNWLARTNKYTEQSFCDYINSKRERGLCEHVAYTEKEYNKLFGDKLTKEEVKKGD